MKRRHQLFSSLPLWVWLATLARLSVAGDFTFDGNVLVATNLTVGGAAIPTNEPAGTAYVAGNLNVVGTSTSTEFVGDGSGLSNVTAMLPDRAVTNTQEGVTLSGDFTAGNITFTNIIGDTWSIQADDIGVPEIVGPGIEYPIDDYDTCIMVPLRLHAPDMTLGATLGSGGGRLFVLNIDGTQFIDVMAKGFIGEFHGDGSGLNNVTASTFSELDPHAVLANGSRAMTGDLNAGGHGVTNVAALTVNGAAQFNQGIACLARMGDLSMGVYTNKP